MFAPSPLTIARDVSQVIFAADATQGMLTALITSLTCMPGFNSIRGGPEDVLGFGRQPNSSRSERTARVSFENRDFMVDSVAGELEHGWLLWMWRSHRPIHDMAGTPASRAARIAAKPCRFRARHAARPSRRRRR